jgi:catechol 2,3-dioxygenase-like lactoylglutathione lyase family enzyme
MNDISPRTLDAAQAVPAAATRPLTRGIHHLALTTEDMKATTDFYVDVLGMPLVHAMKVPEGLGTGKGNRGNPPYECIRHYFFDMGGDGVVAFFEIPKGAKGHGDRDAIGGMQHVAFAITASAFDALQQRLRAHGVAFDGPIETLPQSYSIYFYDPNGIRLEACCKLADGEDQRVIAALTQSRETAQAELRTLQAGNAWMDHVSGHLK